MQEVLGLTAIQWKTFSRGFKYRHQKALSSTHFGWKWNGDGERGKKSKREKEDRVNYKDQEDPGLITCYTIVTH